MQPTISPLPTDVIPRGAVRLFDGKSLANWTTRDGKKPGWKVSRGIVTVVPKTGDIVSKRKFRDFTLHLEFRSPKMPEAKGQAKGNSGVYLQGRYEIQVLDSSGWKVPGLGDCGGIYNVHAPLVNACKPGGSWQTYDVVFRAARVDRSRKVVEKARVTVILNGIVIQNNAEVPGPTGGAMDDKVGAPGPLLLQDHGDLASYRNVWVMELPEKGSDQYAPHN